MTKNSPEIDLKLQSCDELADVLHIHQQEGPAKAQAALRRVIDTYPQLYQDARILLIVSAIEQFIEGSTGADILEIADLLGNAEVAIAGAEAGA